MNRFFTTTVQAGEDLNSHQFLAVCIDDGKVANNGEEATGILLNKPKSGEHATLAYIGEIDFFAGAAISKGNKLTVTTSGYIITADSSDTVVGEAKEAITSGSLGTGFFCFPNASIPSKRAQYPITCTLAAAAGTAYNLKDGQTADNGEEACGVVVSALSSGGTGEMTVGGLCQGLGDKAHASSAGDPLTVTTSGYFLPADSGDYICARAMANIGSNTLGDIYFFSPGAYLSV